MLWQTLKVWNRGALNQPSWGYPSSHPQGNVGRNLQEPEPNLAGGTAIRGCLEAQKNSKPEPWNSLETLEPSSP